jgi:hypothetical protein
VLNVQLLEQNEGVPMMFGEKDHTWTDIVLMEPEQYDVYEKHQQNYFKDSKVEMLDFEKEDARNEEDIDFDNIIYKKWLTQNLYQKRMYYGQ